THGRRTSHDRAVEGHGSVLGPAEDALGAGPGDLVELLAGDLLDVDVDLHALAPVHAEALDLEVAVEHLHLERLAAAHLEDVVRGSRDVDLPDDLAERRVPLALSFLGRSEEHTSELQ